MATPEAFLSALYPLLPLFSTSKSARSLSGKVDGQVRVALDALAAISVANGTGDVVAVALDARPHETKLYVATNGDVKHEVEDHLISVWSCLGRIAKLANGRHSTTSSSDINAHRMDLTLQIYRFSRKKFRSEFEKHSEEFLRVFPQGHTSSVWNSLFDRDQYEVLGYIQSTFKSITDSVKVEKPTDNQVHSLAGLVDKLDRLHAHVNTKIFLEVRRYLRKVLSLRNHIEVLLQIACTKKFRSWFLPVMSVVKVPGMSQSYAVDMGNLYFTQQCFGSRGQFESVRPRWNTEVLEVVRSELINRHCSVSGHGQNTFTFARVFIHCECALAVYIDDHPGAKPFRFIGVSKLCCHGCYTFLRAYNKNVGSPFEFKGTHGKVYLPYVFPKIPSRSTLVSNAAIRRDMLKILKDDFHVAWTQPRRGRRYSDSTAASPPPPDTEQEDQGDH
ncbi:hypothetical protein HETIRDRAFT_328145 [Heterobasidion irregulare TC 32-1]|uniref:Uncharacterized protein n=1 Tax=Heterobasidion irregulare (strain TC 32-1) TaxID=747525 RepID=W4JV33_HETIT|nr:uncharacterized protein HETIRDRAFT_328145 [Heterobasidion irregulare TC 32-1]ETW76741.1 hypothetical protein HETIRDRAFT_328145 [Heterobasidion irregulare TC 32-1]